MSIFMQKGSYTIEAAVYVPMIMFCIMFTLRAGISFYQESQMTEQTTECIEIIEEFYTYQMIKEVGEERIDD